MVKIIESTRSKRGLGSFAKLHNFIEQEAGENLILDRVMQHLQKQQLRKGTVVFEVGDDKESATYIMDLQLGKVKKSDKDKTGDFHALIKRNAFKSIMSGKSSPITALARGELKVSGDLELGKNVYGLLAADKGRIDPCI